MKRILRIGTLEFEIVLPNELPAGDGFLRHVTGTEVRQKRVKIIGEELTWVAVELVDQDGEPVPYKAFELLRKDGSRVTKGTLNEQGYARVDSITAGTYQVRFPELDEGDFGAA